VHIAVANLVQRADGEDETFRQLDTRALHNQRLSIAAQVDREMEARMIARGYTMIPREDGNGCEVGGVSQQVMDLFSSRTATLRAEVAKMAEAYRRKYGHEPSKRTLWLMGQQAAAATRRPKSARPARTGQSAGYRLARCQEVRPPAGFTGDAPGAAPVRGQDHVRVLE